MTPRHHDSFDHIDHIDALSGRIAEAYAEVPVEEGLAEIAVAVAVERKQR